MLSEKYLTLARLSEMGRKYPASRIQRACKGGGVIFNKGLKWSISNGEMVNAWDDFWLASGPLRNQKGRGAYLSRNSSQMVEICLLFFQT